MLFPPQLQTATTTGSGHGRVETRTITLLPFVPESIFFPHIKQIFSIERIRQFKATGKIETEIVYGACQHSAEQVTAQKILGINRSHWGIENKVHYVRDVTFEEDKSRIRTGNGARIMAIFRNLAINLMRSRGVKNIAEKLQQFSWSRQVLLSFLGIIPAALKI